jgi:hypothetical protein
MSKRPIDPKNPPKKATSERDSPKYTNFRAEYKSGRNEIGMENAAKNRRHYSGSPADKGTGKGFVKSAAVATGTASKSLVKATQKKSLKRTNASPQAKAAQKRSYKF